MLSVLLFGSIEIPWRKQKNFFVKFSFALKDLLQICQDKSPMKGYRESQDIYDLEIFSVMSFFRASIFQIFIQLWRSTETKITQYEPYGAAIIVI